MPEGFNHSEKKTNQEIFQEIKKEYPKFQDFWKMVLEETKNGKGSVYFGDNPNPLYVVRLFSQKLNSIKLETATYTSNPEEEMPVKLYQDSMSILQKTMGQAAEIYYGEKDVLDKEGKLINLQ